METAMADSLLLMLEGSRRPEQLAELTRQVSRDLRRRPELRVSDATRPATEGERSGDVALLGHLALTFLSGGAATALITCLKEYVTRDKGLTVRIKAADGRELVIEGKALKADEVSNLVSALERFSSAPPPSR
jgi:hypothetical protein